LHKARGCDGKRHQQRRPTHPPPGERTGGLRIAMVVMMAMMMTGMTVIVTGVVVVTV
jgi:hypothetical protein